MLKYSGGYFGTLIFAHVGITIFHLGLQGGFLYNWLCNHMWLYWTIYAILALGYLVISAQESVNQAGRDAQRLQGCLDRGENEEGKKCYQPWYGLRNAAILEAPVMLLSLIMAFVSGIPGIFVGLLPNLWYCAWTPVKEALPNLFPWLYLAIGALSILVNGLVYPEGKRRFEKMRVHMLENTERIRNREKPIRIPRG